MAVGGGWVWDESFTANADLNAYQYHAVTTGSVAREVKVGTGGSSPIPLGILQNDPNVGSEAVVRLMGKTKAWVSASTGTDVSAGDFLTCGSQGHMELIEGSTAWAVALEPMTAATGCGVIEVLWFGVGFFTESNDK